MKVFLVTEMLHPTLYYFMTRSSPTVCYCEPIDEHIYHPTFSSRELSIDVALGWLSGTTAPVLALALNSEKP